MKISNSKKQLAQIIHENGGWYEGAELAVQGGAVGRVGFCAKRPTRDGTAWDADDEYFVGVFAPDEIIPNWHQTILSRDEYFHLCPVAEAAPDADAASLSSVLGLVTDENKHEHVDSKPTIEQLAADYRNAKDYALRKQREADAAKADAEVKLAELVAAGRALGLVLRIAPSAKTFHNRKVGHPEIYTSDIAREVCEGCGAKAGDHFGLAMFCEHKDAENA